jgi:predicted nucleic acid-binding Zn ribbon protein
MSNLSDAGEVAARTIDAGAPLSILSVQLPLSAKLVVAMRASSSPSPTCPHCGYPAPADARICSLCSTVIHPVNLRRVALWAVVLVEYLVVANVLITH